MELYQSLRIDSSGVGTKFGKWTQVGPTFRIPSGFKNGKRASLRWAVCECACGQIVMVLCQSLNNGASTQCRACMYANTKHSTHGMSNTPAWISWKKMLGRCTNPNNDAWEYYGGRGIKVCDHWRTFVNFYADMGAPPTPKHTIDRIDNDGNYEPSNARWATRREQMYNRRVTRRFEYRGQQMTLLELSKVAGITPVNLRNRIISYGWSVAEAVETPLLLSYSHSTRPRPVQQPAPLPPQQYQGQQ